MTNKKENWEEELEEFALINDFYLRGVPMTKLESHIKTLLKQQYEKAYQDCAKRFREREGFLKQKIKGEYKPSKDECCNIAYMDGFTEAQQKIKEEVLGALPKEREVEIGIGGDPALGGTFPTLDPTNEIERTGYNQALQDIKDKINKL